MSVDLVGSTALKQSGDFPLKKPKNDETVSEAGAKWIIEIANFYRDIQSKFLKEWSHYCKNVAVASGWPAPSPPSLWKANGDELIYVAEIGNSRECVAMIACWLKACKAFRADLHKKRSKLDVKMSAWTAGFPISNTEVIFSSEPSFDQDDWQPELLHYYLIENWHDDPKSRDSLSRDFIGPSLDTGFRISSRSSARKFTVCIELALILSSIVSPKGIDDFKICYEGQENLKGVLGNRPYPVFWIDAHTDDDLSKSEDELTSQSALDHAKIRTYCEQFLERHDAYLLRPFISGDAEPLLAIVPSNYEDKLTQLASAWDKAKSSRQAYLNALANDDKPDEPATITEENQEVTINLPGSVLDGKP